MIFRLPPQKSETEIHVCQFHKENPGVPYAGCTCMYSYKTRNATPEEVEEMNRIARVKRIEELERELAELKGVK